MTETLSKAKNTSVAGMVRAEILKIDTGKVRLFSPYELPEDWDPKKMRFMVWDTIHHMIRVLEEVEPEGVGLMARLGSDAVNSRELAYWFYHMCEQKNYARGPGL